MRDIIVEVHQCLTCGSVQAVESGCDSRCCYRGEKNMDGDEVSLVQTKMLGSVRLNQEFFMYLWSGGEMGKAMPIITKEW